jgi:Kdo2-lipid IVA lauroyltransferase/acyltransferase
MILLFKFLAQMPLPVVRLIGLWMGWMTWLFSARYRRLHRTNWRIAVDSGRLKIHAADLKRRYRSAIGQGGLLAAELPKLWCNPRVISKTTLLGLEHWQAAVAEGKGVLLLTPHLGAFELIPRVLAQKSPITVLYRPARQQIVRTLMETLRPAPGVQTAPATGAGVRQLVRTLRRGETVGMLPDQVPSGGEGQWADFFGRPAYTMTLPMRLLQSTGAAVIWAVAKRTPGGWRLEFERWRPPFDLQSAPMTQALEFMNRGLEDQIALEPAQYLWAYNRYKRPKASSGRGKEATIEAAP